MFEYLLNDNYVFREKLVFTCIEDLCKTFSDNIIPGFLKSLFNKVKQIDSRPREENAHLPSLSLTDRIKFILKTMLKNSKNEIQKSDILTLFKIMCHPSISKTQRDLVTIQGDIDSALKDNAHTLQYYIDTYANEIVTYALFERTGILSPNKTLRAMSTNLLVLLGIYGKLELFIADIAKILTYKPLELIAKLEILFEREFDRISYYDLMFYSEMTKDLLTVFNDKDK